jgi:very-short-patch-repair endonuclease
LLLAIELDGAGHIERAAEDRTGDEWLREQGWTVLRFGNDDIALRCSAVLETIVSEVRRLGSPSP